MAYIKYKELTKYFDFYSEVDINKLPKYVYDYLDDNEKILRGYRTRRDKGIFTDKKMVLFDLKPIGFKKKIHIIPYKSMSSSAILFKRNGAEIQITMDSGYQLRLVFLQMNAEEKTNLRYLYTHMMQECMKKWK